jgi:signal transduction histidine kinase
VLYKFLEDYRDEILQTVETKTVQLAGPRLSSEELRKGIPVFFEHLVSFLKIPRDGSPSKELTSDAAVHGKELLRLQYTLSHVVHAYGAMCQAVTELAQVRGFVISTQDFNHLNLCLDVAIASAVSEFQFQSIEATSAREVQHLGLLVHELRNSLSSATIAHEMIQQGLVGVGGNTSRVLGQSLISMRHLIDRSLSDIRLRADPKLHLESFSLNLLVDQILLTAQNEANGKKQKLKNETAEAIEMNSDRQLLLSTIANLVQNALKYSKYGGLIVVSAKATGDDIVINVLDECGGIADDQLKTMFRPFVSSGFDQSGMGLGLAVVKRAVSLLRGTVEILNHAGHGCEFVVKLRRVYSPKSGVESVEDRVFHPRKVKPAP